MVDKPDVEKDQPKSIFDVIGSTVVTVCAGKTKEEVLVFAIFFLVKSNFSHRNLQRFFCFGIKLVIEQHVLFLQFTRTVKSSSFRLIKLKAAKRPNRVSKEIFIVNFLNFIDISLCEEDQTGLHGGYCY